MNGTWKENVSGYDRKCSKRKRQTRKHTLKDKAKALIRRFKFNDIENDVIRYETKLEYTSDESIIKKSGWVDEYEIEVSTIVDTKIINDVTLDNCTCSLKTAYLENDSWYDVYTNELIVNNARKNSKSKVRIICFLGKKEKIFNKPKIIKNYFFKDKYILTSNTFIYNKPIPKNFWHIYGFYSSRARKHIQRRVNHIDRQRLKMYLTKGDWDLEIKTHALSKSIAWEVY